MLKIESSIEVISKVFCLTLFRKTLSQTLKQNALKVTLILLVIFRLHSNSVLIIFSPKNQTLVLRKTK